MQRNIQHHAMLKVQIYFAKQAGIMDAQQTTKCYRNRNTRSLSAMLHLLVQSILSHLLHEETSLSKTTAPPSTCWKMKALFPQFVASRHVASKHRCKLICPDICQMCRNIQPIVEQYRQYRHCMPLLCRNLDPFVVQISSPPGSTPGNLSRIHLDFFTKHQTMDATGATVDER